MTDFSHIIKDSTLRDRRHAFSVLLSELIIDINNEFPDWQLVIDEVAVHKRGPKGTGRRVLYQGRIVLVEDAQHISKSYHYAPGLAADLVLYIKKEWIFDGNHPAWKVIADRWMAKHPLCTAGIAWNDANHLSFGEGK